MANVIEIKAVKREKAGKGASRAVRRAGYIPAVIYGDKKAPVLFNMEEKVMVALLNKAGFWTHQFEIDVDGEKIRTVCQDVQFHRVSDRPIHADFLRISQNASLTMEIPVHFEGEEKSRGIKDGGVLNIVHRSLEVVCAANNIPEKFVLDVSDMNIGDTKTTKDIQLPAGCKFTSDEEMTVVSIGEPAKEKADAQQATEETKE
jgi:large subunit ribosomal protein L25